jgi:glycolate oxidase
MQSLAEELRKVLPAEVVLEDAASLEAASRDKWDASALPEVVVKARDAEQVSTLLRWASEARVPVTPRGAGIGYVGGAVPVRGGVVLDVSGMNRILEISVEDAVAVVQPGVITGQLQAEVRQRGMYYPPDPASLKECSIGGNLATNAGGPRCLKYGVTRHYVLGIEVVLPNGDIVRAGGRTHKNKTGFDLIGMFVGSEGMLGVITEATLRLIPLPPQRATISTSFASAREAAAAVQAIFAAGYLPAAVEIADRFTLEASRKYSGRELSPYAQAHLLIDLDGQPESVAAEVSSLAALLALREPLTLETAVGEQACEALWEIRREFSYSLRATGLTKLNEDVVVPRGRLVDLMDFAASLQERHGVPVACFGHAGDGNIHVNLMVDRYYEDAAVRAKMAEVLDELFMQVLAWGGSITGEHGIGLAKKRWFPAATSPENRDLHRTLKKALDPAGILNPGKFLELEGDSRVSMSRYPHEQRA